MPSTKRSAAMVKPFFNTLKRDNDLTKRGHCPRRPDTHAETPTPRHLSATPPCLAIFGSHTASGQNITT